MKVNKVVSSIWILLSAVVAPKLSLANDNTSFSYFGISHKFNDSEKLAFETTGHELQSLDSSLSSSHSGSGNRLFLGYQANEFMGLELGYSSSVNGSYTYTNLNDTTNKISGSASASVWDIRLIGTKMFTGNFFMKGAIGHNFWRQKIDQLVYVDEIYQAQSAYTKGEGLMLSLGFGLGISRTKAFTIDFESVEIEDNQVNSLVLSYVGKF